MMRFDFRAVRAANITIAAFLTVPCIVFGQGTDRFENWCDSMRNASPPDLVQYLNRVVPDNKNAECVTIAIRKLGRERYGPAVTALVRLLDFRRPPTEDEKRGIYERPQITEELFPATEALELIGKEALPEVLGVIEAAPTSRTALDNAVSVWMENYKYERPKGIALLKQAENKLKDDAVKQKLRLAVEKALTYCGPPKEEEGAACRQAALTGVQ